MSDLEYVGKMNPQKLKSFDEEQREWREQIARDKDRWDSRNKPKPVPETTREPIPQIDQLIASGQVMPASQLAAKRAQDEQLAKDMEEAVRSEESHRRTKVKTQPDKTVAHYTREPFEG